MSKDYATCVSEAFDPERHPGACAHFVRDEWTKIEGEYGNMAFARVVVADDAVSEAYKYIADIEDFCEDATGLRFCVIDDAGRITEISFASIRADRKEARIRLKQRAERARIMAENAARDIAGNDGRPNPELDSFLG